MNHLKSKLQKVLYSNVSGIQMVTIHIPTVMFICIVHVLHRHFTSRVNWEKDSIIFTQPNCIDAIFFRYSHSSDASRRINSDDESTVNVTVDSPNVTPPRTDDPPDLASVMQLFQVNYKLDLNNFLGTQRSAIWANFVSIRLTVGAWISNKFRFWMVNVSYLDRQWAYLYGLFLQYTLITLTT